MKTSDPLKIALGTLGYVVVTFLTQGTSHFAINREHYAAVASLRTEPIFALGIASMLIQGSILSYLYPIFCRGGSSWIKGLGYGVLIGVFFVSYPALAEPGKYIVPSIPSWIMVEGSVGLIQFGLFGLLLAAIYRSLSDHRVVPAHGP